MVGNKFIVLAIIFLIGLISGYLLFDWQNKDSVIIKTVTKSRIDTVYIEIRDTIRLTKIEIQHEYIRDTVLIDFKPQIKAFRASKPFLYGNTYLSGEVLGEVLKMDIYNDFKLPTVTNTITNTTTIIKKPSGLFLTAGVQNNFSAPYIGAIFIKDKYLLGLNTGGFQIGYKLK